MLEPIDRSAVELLLDGDVGHSPGRSRSMPVLLARREPDHVSRTDFFDRAAFPLSPAETGRHDQRLPQRVRVPRSPGTGFERDARTTNPRRIRGLEQRIDPDRTGKLVGW